MIVAENLIINNREMVKHYSDKNVYIRKLGTQEEYGEAIDLLNQNFVYEETEKLIEETNETL